MAVLEPYIAKVFASVGLVLHGEQEPIVASGKRFLLVSGGDRGGKSRVSAAVLEARYLGQQVEKGERRPKLYWLVAVDYAKTRREFEYLVEDFGKMGLLDGGKTSKRVDPGVIVLVDGTKIETKSANDPRTLGMDAPDGILGCEASQLDVESWRRLNGRVAEKRGWICLSGSPEGSLGWFPSLYEAWKGGYGEQQSFSLPAWTNVALFPGGRNDPEIKRLEAESSDEWFMERIGGVPCPPKGLVFGEVREDIHVQSVEWAGESEVVYIWEDPGYGTSSAHAIEVAQITKEGQVQVFWESYTQGLITSEVIQVCKQQPWWKSPKVLVTDPQYKDQHHSMTSVAEEWLKETGLVAGGERGRILPGIERMKGFLKPDPLTQKPNMVFSPRCKGVLSELGMQPHPLPGPRFGQTCVYHWKVDDNGNTVGEVPQDEYNHGVKAIGYGLVAKFGWGYAGDREKIKVTYFPTKYAQARRW